MGDFMGDGGTWWCVWTVKSSGERREDGEGGDWQDGLRAAAEGELLMAKMLLFLFVSNDQHQTYIYHCVVNNGTNALLMKVVKAANSSHM